MQFGTLVEDTQGHEWNIALIFDISHRTWVKVGTEDPRRWAAVTSLLQAVVYVVRRR
jgi:hypothetical protein